jgi:hypothetical protein
VNAEPTPNDVALLAKYCNTVGIDDALAWLDENECFGEQAWLAAAQEALERQWTATVMTAYAHARGELESIILTLPADGPDDA